MRAVTYSHKYLQPVLNEQMIGIDMTCGVGNDTRFLADHIARVYSFDIQNEAIVKAQTRLAAYSNITFINDSHARLDHYVDDKIDVAMFNLGYLPKSSGDIITKACSTITALDKLYACLKDRSLVSIVFYRGHKGGFDEYYRVLDYIRSSPYKVLDHYEEYRDPFEPVVYILTK